LFLIIFRKLVLIIFEKTVRRKGAVLYSGRGRNKGETAKPNSTFTGKRQAARAAGLEKAGPPANLQRTALF